MYIELCLSIFLYISDSDTRILFKKILPFIVQVLFLNLDQVYKGMPNWFMEYAFGVN